MTAPATAATVSGRIGLGRVLVATDLSLDGDRAVRRAASLPLKPRARLLLVYAVPPAVDRATETVVRGAAEVELEAARAKLQEWLAARRRGDVSVGTKVVRGQPADAIADLGRAIDAELICVGRRGQSRLQRALIGSVARRVVRIAGRPVLVVSRAPAAPYREAIVGHDLSAAANRAARIARRVVPISGRLSAVHAHEDPLQGLPPGFAPAPGKERRTASERIIRDRATELQAAVEPLAVAGRAWRVVLERGDPRTVLLKQVERRRADLLVVGSAGLSGVGRFLVGSVAESVLERAPCDVLVVRTGG